MSEDIYIRRATREDTRFLFELRNDPAVVEASATGRGVEWNTHLLWFDQKLAQKALLLIAMAGDRPVGYIRFDPLLEFPDTYEVAVGIVEEFRGRGIGRALISKASSVAEALGATKLVARIKPDNTASVKAFQAAGYRRDPDNPAVTSEAGVKLERYVRWTLRPANASTGGGDAPLRRRPRCDFSESRGGLCDAASFDPLRILLVADFGQKAGLGHLRRMVALGEAIAVLGSTYAIAIAAPREDSPSLRAREISGRPVLHFEHLEWVRQAFDAAVVDSYRLSRESFAAIAPSLVVADGAAPPLPAPILVDPAPGADKAIYAGLAEQVLAGAEYALLTSELWDPKPSPPSFPPRRIFVTLGSAADQAFVAEVLRTLETYIPSIEISRAEEKSAPEDYIAQLLEADIVITAGGVSSLEAARAGRPSVGVVLAPNQSQNVRGLAAAGALVMAAPEPESIASAAAEIARKRDLFDGLASAGPRAVDGKGACRVARLLLQHLQDAPTRSPGETQ